MGHDLGLEAVGGEGVEGGLEVGVEVGGDRGGVAAMFRWGSAGDVPVVGDWDGDGFDTVGLYRNGAWLLTDEHVDALLSTTQEPAYTEFRWGTE